VLIIKVSSSGTILAPSAIESSFVKSSVIDFTFRTASGTGDCRV
jgi:hypothetical protein